MVKKFVRVKGAVSISHDDQEKFGLTFRVQFKHGVDNIMLINGEEADINKYIADHDCLEIDRSTIKGLYDDTFPSKTVQCEHCNGTGNRTIPEYDVDKEEADVKEATK